MQGIRIHINVFAPLYCMVIFFDVRVVDNVWKCTVVQFCDAMPLRLCKKLLDRLKTAGSGTACATCATRATFLISDF